MFYLALSISLITIAARATNNMILTTVPLLGRYVLQFNDADVGALEALGFVATFISTSLLNPRLDEYRRKRAFVLSNSIILASLLLYPYSSPLTIWAITATAGAASGIIMPNLISAASTTSDLKTTERLLAIYTTSLSASLIIGPFLETQILRSFGYKQVFFAFSALAIIAVVLSFSIHFPEGRKHFSGLEALKSKGFLAATLSNSTYSVPFAAITTFLAIYAAGRFDLSRSYAYLSFIPFFAVSFAVRLSLAIFPRRYLRPLFSLSVIITAAGLLSLYLVPDYALFLVAVSLLGVPHGSIYPMSTIFIARGTERNMRNAVNSYFLAFNNILFASVPFAVGYMATFIGLGLSFLLLVIPVLLSAFLFLARFADDSIMKRAQGM